MHTSRSKQTTWNVIFGRKFFMVSVFKIGLFADDMELKVLETSTHVQ